MKHNVYLTINKNIENNKKINLDDLSFFINRGYSLKREFLVMASPLFLSNNFDIETKESMPIKLSEMTKDNTSITGFARLNDNSIYEVEFRNMKDIKGLTLKKVYQ